MPEPGPTPARILVVEDEAYVAGSLRELLEAKGFEVRLESTAEGALAWLGRARVDAVLTDLKLPGASGEELVGKLGVGHPGLPVVVLTGHGNVRSAVACLKAGATDYILKPADPEVLTVSLERALARRAQEDRAADDATERPIGDSPVWRSLMERVAAAARSDSTVLLLGESGTGKELLAHRLHASSERAAGPYVRVNCSALPLEMWESEFFGHRRGAFTGATNDRDGRFRLADGGTLFMDEIGTMPLAAQAKVLRALENGEFERLGDDRTTRVDVRVVAATNSDLEAEVEAGRFRRDLYYRLNVVPLRVPPLRERASDIPLLVDHFVAQISARLRRVPPVLGPGVLDTLAAHRWPGNVRELRNVLERALVLTPGDALEHVELPDVSGGRDGSGRPDGGLELRSCLARAERDLVLEALQRSGGVRKEAARLLGIDPRNLPYYLRKHDIDPDA